MILGIGLDLTDVEAVIKRLRKSREILLDVLFNPAELEVVRQLPETAEPTFVAGRWAAKEAVLKALGTGIGPISLHEVLVPAMSSGQPYIELQGRASGRALFLGIKRWHITITHEGQYAAAFVIAEGD